MTIKKLWSNFVRTWQCHTAMQIATLAVLVGSYTVVTLFFSVHKNLRQILTQWGDSVAITAYVDKNMESEQTSTIKKKILALGDFEKVEFVSKKAAAQKFQDQLGNYAPDLFSDSEFGNPLPRSFNIKIDEKAGQYENLVQTAEKIRNITGIGEVSYGQNWVKNYSSLVKSFSASSWMLIIILLSGSLFVVSNSIRNSIAQRRDEIEILELVGATPAMIRWPYIFEGMVMGFLASVISSVLSYFLYLWQTQLFEADLSFLGIAGHFTYLEPMDLFLVIFIGTAFGALGAYLCVRRLCTGWAAAQRQESWAY